MEPDVIIKGRVKNGKRLYYNDRLLESRLSELEGREFEEIIRLKQEPKSEDQFGYYFAGVIRMGCKRSEMFGGWTETEIHDFLKDKFLTYTKVKEINGVPHEYIVQESLSGISKRKMSAFMEQVIAFCEENGIRIPEPDEIKLNKYKTVKKNGGKKTNTKQADKGAEEKSNSVSDKIEF